MISHSPGTGVDRHHNNLRRRGTGILLFRIASDRAIKAFSISSPHGGGTRLFSFRTELTLNGTEVAGHLDLR
jgi:hypothetical protein